VKRIYPDFIPPYWMEPTSDDFEVLDSLDKGRGLYAKRAFSKGELLFICSGVSLPKVTQHSLEHGYGHHIHDPWVMGFLLHSCRPNLTVNMSERSFIATRDIQSGDALTMDYNETESVLYKSFICTCGSCENALIEGSYASETNEQRISRLLLSSNWRFAKTLKHIPHFYTRGREWPSSEDFVWCCEYIQTNSTKGTFKETGGYEFNYLYLGEWKYWVMERDKPASDQILINKASIK